MIRVQGRVKDSCCHCRRGRCMGQGTCGRRSFHCRCHYNCSAVVDKRCSSADATVFEDPYTAYSLCARCASDAPNGCLGAGRWPRGSAWWGACVVETGLLNMYRLLTTVRGL